MRTSPRYFASVLAYLALVPFFLNIASAWEDPVELSLPLPSHVWTVPSVGLPKEDRVVRDLQTQYRKSNMGAICTRRPVIVKDFVIASTESEVLGIGFRNGKRIWMFPWETGFDPDVAQRRPPRNHRFAIHSRLRSTFWFDSIDLATNVDADRVFVVRSPASRVTERRLLLEHAFNELVALDVAQEGKLRWRIGGKDGEDEKKLAGCFFLAAPTVVGDKLYVLAEIESKVLLLSIDAKTGRLNWRLKVADAGENNVLNSRHRRVLGTQVAIRGDTLVCSTVLGKIIAVDIAKRAIKWTHKYASSVIPALGVVHEIHPFPEPGNRWEQHSILIVGKVALVTPPDSDMLFCLNLEDGKPARPSEPRDAALWIEKLDGDRVFGVGRKDVNMIHAADGKSVWAKKLDLPAAPSGMGVWSGRTYLLPTTDSAVLSIDLKEGRIADRQEMPESLGNLVRHKGSIISQSPTRVSVYRERETVRRDVDARLKREPNDHVARLQRARLQLHAGKITEAIALADKLLVSRPDDVEAQDLYLKTVVAGASTQVPGIDTHAKRAAKLLVDAKTIDQYYMAFVGSYIRQGRNAEALALIMEYAECVSGRLNGWLSVGDQLRVRRSRWIQSQTTLIFSNKN